MILLLLAACRSPRRGIFPFPTIIPDPSATASSTLPFTSTPTPTSTLTPPSRPTATRAPTRTPTSTLPPTLTPVPTHLPGTPAAESFVFALRAWSEQDSLDAMAEVRQIYDLPHSLEGTQPFIYYFDALLTGEKEFLLRFPDSPHQAGVEWELAQNEANNISHVFPESSRRFMTLLQNALNEGQTSVDQLKKWLPSHGFELEQILTADNLAGDGNPAWVLVVRLMGNPSYIRYILAIFMDAAGTYHIEQVNHFTYFWGDILVAVGDYTGNGQPEIVYQRYYWGSGSSTFEDYYLALYEWRDDYNYFVNLAAGISPLMMDEMIHDYPHFPEFSPWGLVLPDSSGIMPITGTMDFWITGEDCPSLQYQFTYTWNGQRYRWAHEGLLPYDLSAPPECQIPVLLLTGGSDPSAPQKLSEAVETAPQAFLDEWGPAAKDYLHFLIGVLYAIHGQREPAIRALESVWFSPLHPEYQMASLLAQKFLSAYLQYGPFQACTNAIDYLDGEMRKMPAGIFRYIPGSMIESWGFDDNRWIWDGSAVCDRKSLFSNTLVQRNPRNLAEFYQWLDQNAIPFTRLQALDVTGDGTQDWLSVLKLTEDSTWQVLIVVRDDQSLVPVFASDFYSAVAKPQSWFSIFRHESGMSPVVVLASDRYLSIFKLVYNDLWGIDAMYSTRFDHIELDLNRQQITGYLDEDDYYYSFSESEKVTVGWNQELGLFQFKDATMRPQARAILDIEQALFEQDHPAQALERIRALLAGPIREYENTWCSEGCSSPPFVKPYLMYLKGLAYELLGDEIEAAQAYWQLWQAYPDNAYALFAIRKLELMSP